MRANSGLAYRSGLWVPEYLADRRVEHEFVIDRPRDPRDVVLSPAVRAYRSIRAVLSNDSVTVTPGAGATIATHLAGGKEHQVVLVADSDGHIQNSKDDWFVWFTPATNANARSVGDLFNADASAIVRVRGVWIVPTVTAITGAQIAFDLNRTNTVGTAGTVMTPRALDHSSPALSASITARAGATGGAALQYLYLQHYHFNEETNAATPLIQHQNLLPSSIGNRVAEVILRQNQGLQVKQSVAMTTGLTGCLMYFTVE